MPNESPIIVWFRQDLRLADHPALRAAVESGRPVLPVYVLDEVDEEVRPPGGASRWWLHSSLQALRDSLGACGSGLVLRRGRAAEVLAKLAEDSGARDLHFTRGYGREAAQERAVHAALVARGVGVRRFGGRLLFEPERIATKDGRPYRVFTPFWRTCREQPPPAPPVAAPETITAPESWPKSDDLDSWALRPSKPDWAGGLRETWEPGEVGARERLGRFVDEALTGYHSERDRPDCEGTSLLSAHLHFGELSPRQAWQVVSMRSDSDGASTEGAEAFRRELGWREFSHHLLHHWPEMPDAPFQPAFADFPWRDANAATLRAWQRGRTGYPMVDAGMRQLWHTGWMHNRVRMLTASFLVKHLLLHWKHGEAWFWDTLVDADPANNVAGWQWVAGSGADAAPYFRIFNPITQGQKFDPAGAYVRQWVPELADLPDKYLHSPWTAPADVLEKAGVVLGETYPEPIVEHAAARKRALAAFANMKERA